MTFENVKSFAVPFGLMSCAGLSQWAAALSLPVWAAWLAMTLFPCVFARFLLRYFSGRTGKILGLFSFAVPLLGPFATLGTLAALFVPFRAYAAREFREFLATDLKFDPVEKLEFGLIENYWKDGQFDLVEPFVDIMKGDNLLRKRSAIDKVVQHPGFYSKEILELGLADLDQEIRFYAASALIMLNDRFMAMFRECEKKIRAEPGNAENFLELAESYDTYCFWGLPEKEDRKRYGEMMKENYYKALQLSPNNETALLGIGRVLLREKEIAKAHQYLSWGIAVYPDSEGMISWYLETLFFKQEYGEIEKFAQKYSKSELDRLGYEVRSVLKYWSGTPLEENDFPEMGRRMSPLRGA